MGKRKNRPDFCPDGRISHKAEKLNFTARSPPPTPLGVWPKSTILHLGSCNLRIRLKWPTQNSKRGAFASYHQTASTNELAAQKTQSRSACRSALFYPCKFLKGANEIRIDGRRRPSPPEALYGRGRLRGGMIDMGGPTPNDSPKLSTEYLHTLGIAHPPS